MRETQQVVVSRTFFGISTRFGKTVGSFARSIKRRVGICLDRTRKTAVQNLWPRSLPISGKAISDMGAHDHDLSVEGVRDYLSPTLLDEGEESTDRAYLGIVLSGDGFRYSPCVKETC